MFNIFCYIVRKSKLLGWGKCLKLLPRHVSGHGPKHFSLGHKWVLWIIVKAVQWLSCQRPENLYTNCHGHLKNLICYRSGCQGGQRPVINMNKIYHFQRLSSTECYTCSLTQQGRLVHILLSIDTGDVLKYIHLIQTQRQAAGTVEQNKFLFPSSCKSGWNPLVIDIYHIITLHHIFCVPCLCFTLPYAQIYLYQISTIFI